MPPAPPVVSSSAPPPVASSAPSASPTPVEPDPPAPSVSFVIKEVDAHGPDHPWSFAVHGYPALHVSGRKAAVPWYDDGFSGSPSLHVDLIDPRTSDRMQRIDVLSERELTSSATLGALEAKVRKRVEKLNAAIEPASWTPLVRCSRPEPQYYEAYTSDEPQRVSCGELSLSYVRASVHVENKGRKLDRALPRLAGGAVIAEGEVQALMNDALLGVYTDEARTFLLLNVGYGAAGGGDGWSWPSRWQALRAP
jgi:hypothetical protein